MILVGNGAVWQYKAARLNTIKSTAEFREREIAVYRDIIAIADSLSREYDEHYKTDTPGEFAKRLAPIKAQIEMRISDYKSLEKQLATLEGRQPRDIPLDFLKPSAPSNVKIEIEKP